MVITGDLKTMYMTGNRFALQTGYFFEKVFLKGVLFRLHTA